MTNIYPGRCHGALKSPEWLAPVLLSRPLTPILCRQYIRGCYSAVLHKTRTSFDWENNHMISVEHGLPLRNVHWQVAKIIQWLGAGDIARALVIAGLHSRGSGITYRPTYFHCWVDSTIVPVAALPHIANLLTVLQTAQFKYAV